MLHMAGNSSSFLLLSSKRDKPCHPVPHLARLFEQVKVHLIVKVSLTVLNLFGLFTFPILKVKVEGYDLVVL